MYKNIMEQGIHDKEGVTIKCACVCDMIGVLHGNLKLNEYKSITSLSWSSWSSRLVRLVFSWLDWSVLAS